MGTGVNRVCCDCGGSASLIHQASVTLTDAQIRTDATNVPFPTATALANRIYRLVGMWVTTHFEGGAYTNISGTELAIVTDDQFDFTTNFTSVTSVLAQAASKTFSLDVSTGPIDPANQVNQGLNVVIYNNAGNLTGGHVDNTMDVRGIYLIENVLTGLYE